MPVLLSAITLGLILSLLALGVFISFRIFDFPDITADGSMTSGAAIAGILIASGYSPVVATLGAVVGGFAAGTVTGVLHARFGINKLLAGILVMIGLYSVNLRIMGQSHISLFDDVTLMTHAQRAGETVLSAKAVTILDAWNVTTSEVMVLLFSLVGMTLCVALLYLFFRTNLGLSMRACGGNAPMMRALGVNVNIMVILGIGLSNALIALSGAIYAQYSGYADIQLGIGMIVFGLASVIIGESIVRSRLFGWIITGAVIGSIVFRIAVAVVLQAGVPQQDLKLITAGFVFIALVLPALVNRLRSSRIASQKA